MISSSSTIWSAGSSTRIEGSRLSGHEVGALLANLDICSFSSRDEEKVVGHAEAMNVVFESFEDIPSTVRAVSGMYFSRLEKTDKRHV